MADEQKFYPRGEVSIGGTLKEITGVSVSTNRGVRLTHSIAMSPSGWSSGNKEVTGTFDMEIPEGGQERDWFEAWRNNSRLVATVKLPGETRILNIVVGQEQIQMRSDGPVTRNISFVGWWTLP